MDVTFCEESDCALYQRMVALGYLLYGVDSSVLNLNSVC